MTMSASAYQFMVDGLCYNWHRHSDDNSVYVTRQNSSSPTYTSLSGDVNIPSSVTYNGKSYPVTEIDNGAFSDCSGLTSVTIPNSVTEIGSFAFDGCISLKTVNWNARNCADFSNSDYAPFQGLTGITTFNFGNEVEKIPAYLCYDHSGLKSATIPNSVKTISDYAFDGCSGLTSVTIGNSVTSIGYSAFSGCSGLTSVTIPNSVTEIGNWTFANCSGLTSVTIPNSVTSIGDYAFHGCSGLTKVEISDLAAWCKISFGDFSANPLYYAKHLYLNGSEIKDLVIPNSVTSIGDYAFYGCSGLTSVTIPNSVTSIGEDAFEYCSELKNLTGIKLTYNSWYKSFVGTKTSSVFSKKLDNENAAKERAQRAKEQAEFNKFKQSVGIKAYNSLNQGLIYNGMKFSSIQKFCERYSNDYSLRSAGYGSNGASLWNLFVRWNDSYTRKYRFWVKNGLVSGFSYEMYYDPKN